MTLRMKLFLAVVATLGALVLALWLVEPVAPAVDFARPTRTTNRLLVRGMSNSSLRAEDFRLERIDEATAHALFVMNNPNFAYDPDCYYRFVAHIDETFAWDEHPAGEWSRRTNRFGWREDDDRGFGGDGRTVLVTGDSHTDGACNNAESLAQRLEALADLRNRSDPINAINTGVVGYSFYNYLGILEKYREEDPDAFVVVVYGGNDFLEALKPQHFFRGTTMPPRRPGYWNKIEAAKSVSTTALAQVLNQVLYFQEYPDQIEVALDAALITAREIRRICAEEGMRLIYVYVPPAFEAPWPELGEMQSRAMEKLDVTAFDLEVAERIAARFFEGLSDLGVSVLDMGPHFRAHDELCYWQRDLHINLNGHALIARELERALATDVGRLAGALSLEREPGPFEERFENGELRVRGNYAAVTRDGESKVERSGLWTRWYSNGAKHSEGNYFDGLRGGPWSFYYEDGKLKKRGAYADGREDGEWREWFRDGQERVRGHWSAGQPTGRWQQWHPGGARASDGDYVGGLQSGPWTTWYPNESVDVRAHFEEGVLHGAFKKFRDDGTLMMAGTFQDGLHEGPWTYYWPNGERKSQGACVAGERQGRWVFWTEDGSVDPEQSGHFKNGQREHD